MQLLRASVLCLALVAQLCFAEFTSLSFSGNVTVSASGNDANSFSARSVSFATGSIGAFGGFYYRSTTASGGGGNLEVDTVLGGGIVSASVPPFFFLGHRTGTINFSITDVLTFDASAASNFMANLYVRLVERTSAGVTVKVQPLVQSALDAAAGVNWALQGGVRTGAEGRLQWTTFRGTPFGASWYVDVTVVASSVIGRLETAAANALVSPKSLEVIIQIENYPYADNANHLALVVASCSGTGSTSASSFVTGTGLSRMYLYVSSGARINGNLQQVNVEAWTTVDSNAYDTLIGNPTLKTMLQAKFNNNFSCQATNVTFPAGAASITFDPTLGAGATLAENSSDASTLAAGLIVVFSALAALLL